MYYSLIYINLHLKYQSHSSPVACAIRFSIPPFPPRIRPLPCIQSALFINMIVVKAIQGRVPILGPIRGDLDSWIISFPFWDRCGGPNLKVIGLPLFLAHS